MDESSNSDISTRIRRHQEKSYDSIVERMSSEYQISNKEYAFLWPDLNLIRHAELINKLSSMMLTHLDVLNDVEEIKLATKYILD